MAMQPDNPLTSYRTTDAKLFDISEETLDIYSNVTTLKIEKVNNIVELDMILESFPKVVSVEIELLTANAYETAIFGDSFNNTVADISSKNNYNNIKSVRFINFKAARIRDLKFIESKFRKVEIVFSNSLCLKKKGINVCCEDVILDNLKTAMDTCMINQHDVCLLLNKDDKVLVVIQDVIQKEALWNDHVRNLRIEAVLVNRDDEFSALAKQYLPQLRTLEINDVYVTTENITEFIRLFKPRNLHVIGSP